MIYDAKYFYKKFKAIPANKWCIYKLQDGNKHCAFGHCGAYGCAHTLESFGLMRLGFRANINDGFSPRYRQRGPKARTLAFFKDCIDEGK